MSKEVIETLDALKSEFKRLDKWTDRQLITYLEDNWENRETFRNSRNLRLLKNRAETEFLDRVSDNPDNTYIVDPLNEATDAFNILIGTIEMIDPLVALAAKTNIKESIACGTARTANVQAVKTHPHRPNQSVGVI